MEVSPFRYQGPLAPDQLRGRDDLLADLSRRVTQRRVTALLGPRRYGKTSVLDRLAVDLGELATVAVDLYGVQSVADVATRLDDALQRAPAPFVSETSEVATTVGVHLGVVRAEFARPRRRQPDASTLLSQLLDVFVGTAVRVPTLLVLDEFSDIGNAAGAAELMRTKFQRHYDHFGLLFAGSRVSTMHQLFTDREQPFYAQADTVEIGPLDGATVHDLVGKGFNATGRSPGNAAGRILALTRGHPQRTMLMADTIWQRTPAGARADDHWGDALTEVRAALDSGMSHIHDHLASGEQRVLRLVAHDEPLHGTVATQLGLTAGPVTHAHKRLVARGHIHQHDGAFVDPMFADWFRQTLPLP